MSFVLSKAGLKGRKRVSGTTRTAAKSLNALSIGFPVKVSAAYDFRTLISLLFTFKALWNHDLREKQDSGQNADLALSGI